MDKDKSLRKLSDRRNWLRGNLGLALVGGAMLSKSLIQLSVDGCSCGVPSLLFIWSRELAKHAVSEGTKAVTKYTSSK